MFFEFHYPSFAFPNIKRFATFRFTISTVSSLSTSSVIVYCQSTSFKRSYHSFYQACFIKLEWLKINLPIKQGRYYNRNRYPNKQNLCNMFSLLRYQHFFKFVLTIRASTLARGLSANPVKKGFQNAIVKPSRFGRAIRL